MSRVVAVIGCGYWGKNLVRNFNQLGRAGHGLRHDRSWAKERHPGGTRRADCGRSGPGLGSAVEAVVIATPAETHHTLVKQALEAGKDVFVEKPLALTYGEGAELVRLAERQGRILMVGHVLEYHPGGAPAGVGAGWRFRQGTLHLLPPPEPGQDPS